MARRDNAAILRDYAGTDLWGTALLSSTKRITTAQLLTLNSAPITIVAPSTFTTDTGMGIVVSHAVFRRPSGTTAYAGANTIQLRYVGTADPIIISMAQADLLNASNAATVIRYGLSLDTDAPILANTGVELFASANPTAGTMDLWVQVYYYITPVNLDSRF